MRDREKQFGRLLAIATVLFDKIEPNGSANLNLKYSERFRKKPMDTIVKIHEEIMENAHKFDETHYTLLDMFQEILASMDFNDFNNEPLQNKYLWHYHKERNDWTNMIMDTKEASELWGLSQDYLKVLCQKGELKAKKIGRSWAIFKGQPNPKKYNV